MGNIQYIDATWIYPLIRMIMFHQIVAGSFRVSLFINMARSSDLGTGHDSVWQLDQFCKAVIGGYLVCRCLEQNDVVICYIMTSDQECYIVTSQQRKNCFTLSFCLKVLNFFSKCLQTTSNITLIFCNPTLPVW